MTLLAIVQALATAMTLVLVVVTMRVVNLLEIAERPTADADAIS